MFKKLPYIFLIGIFVSLTACSSKSTGVEEGTSPEIPEVSKANPDFSYFKSTSQKMTVLAGNAYSNASLIALQAEGFISIGPSLFSFFEDARGETAEMEDGQWVWNYSVSDEQGNSAEVKLTAEVNESANEAKWVMYVSESVGGQDLDNFKFMEGTSSLDGSTGDWKIYSPEVGDDTPVFSYTWTIDGDDNLEATFDFNYQSTVQSINYQEDGAEHWLVFGGTDSNIEVYWDADNDYGYYWDKTNGDKQCWTSDKSSISCAEIGLD